MSGNDNDNDSGTGTNKAGMDALLKLLGSQKAPTKGHAGSLAAELLDELPPEMRESVLDGVLETGSTLLGACALYLERNIDAMLTLQFPQDERIGVLRVSVKVLDIIKPESEGGDGDGKAAPNPETKH
jgi:hypothetical protein